MKEGQTGCGGSKASPPHQLLTIAALALIAFALFGTFGIAWDGGEEVDAEVVEVSNGTCGTGLTWTLDSNGLLKIDGSGPMENYTAESTRWGGSLTSVMKVVIGDSVTSIGDYAFYECKEMKSAQVGKSVESVGTYAFGTCEKLQSIHLPDSVGKIGPAAFDRCHQVISANIPKEVDVIEEGLFRFCWALQRVTVEGTITSIEDDAFWGCRDLTHITFPGQDPESTAVVVPDSVKYIGICAFGECHMTSITIPRVSVIKASTFAYCVFEEFVIPDSVTTIEIGAFSNSGLKNIVVPDSVTSFGKQVFYFCSKLETATLPGTLSTIPESTFSRCESLKSFVIPDSVTSIGNYAFQECKAMKSVTIPDSVTSIGECAFNECHSLESVRIPKDVTEIKSNTFHACRKMTSVEFAGPIETIGYMGFASCLDLETIEIPETIKTLAVKAFWNCQGLKEIEIPESITEIADYLFGSCISLSSVTIRGDVTYIGGGAFRNCYLLDPFTIPSTVTYIGAEAFGFCKALKSISIPSSVTAIQEGTFGSCTSLTSISIPDSVTTIGGKAFGGCTSLTSISIPSTVTTIGEKAFYNHTFYATEDGDPLDRTAEGLAGYRYAGETVSKMLRQGPAVTVYTVTFEPNGGSCPTTSMQTDADGRLASLPTASKQGHSFDGWYTAPSGGDEVTVSTVFGKDTVLYAQWTAQSGYTVFLDPQGGSCSVWKMRTDADGRLASLPAPEFEYHRFQGWYTSASGGDWVTGSTVFGADSTIYAHWSEIRVTYDHSMLVEATGDPDSGAGLSGGFPVSEGATYTQLPDTAGYRHTGWKVGDVTVGPTAGLVSADAHTAFSIWERIPEEGGFVPTTDDSRWDGGMIIAPEEESGGDGWDSKNILLLGIIAVVIAELAVLQISRRR